MEFTPLDGLVMQTRSGAVDPGLLLWLLHWGGVHDDELADALELSSGLKGLSGTSGDLRRARGACPRGRGRGAGVRGVRAPSGRQHRGDGGVGRGLDLLVFAGGMGEHSPELREAVLGRLGFLGCAVDSDLNLATSDAVISPDGVPVAGVVVSAAEDVEVARQTRQLAHVTE